MPRLSISKDKKLVQNPCIYFDHINECWCRFWNFGNDSKIHGTKENSNPIRAYHINDSSKLRILAHDHFP